MAPTDDLRDPPAGAPHFPVLINDYRAQQEALRAQVRDLARIREEVLVAAEREARGIVAAARGEVRQVLVKARGDLRVLASQVDGAIDTPPDTGSADAAGDGERSVQALVEDLRVARDVFTSARRDARGVQDAGRSDVEVLDEGAAAVRSDLRQHQASAPLAPRPAPVVHTFPSEAEA